MRSSQPTRFEILVQSGIEWIRLHTDRALTVLGVTALAGVLLFFVIQQRQRQKQDAWTDLGAIQGSLMNEQWEAARKGLDDWKTKYPGSSAESYARFLEADLLYRSTDYARAAAIYGELSAQARPALLRPLALSAQMSAEEMAGKWTEAKASAQRFLAAYPDHYLAAQVTLSQGRLAEKGGDLAAAAAIYERFVILYPQTPWTDSVKNHLQKIAPPKVPSTPTAVPAP